MKEDNKFSFYRDPSAMFPMMPETGIAELEKLAAEIISLSGKLSEKTHPETANAIATLVEPMNSYYSNLIEGRPTHPLDIEKTLKKEYSKGDKNASLKLEAVAHIEANRRMKADLQNNSVAVLNTDFICGLHFSFYEFLPEEFRHIVLDGKKPYTIIPGKVRDIEVEVGNHIAPAHDRVSKFLDVLWNAYSDKHFTSPLHKIILIAASHHRIAWIHPFADGNGRVTRLFSEGLFIKEKCSANSIWSISRGLARKREDYYALLNNADQTRRNDTDGRGNLSDKALFEFCKFFLETAIDQLEFMRKLLDLDSATERVNSFVDLMVIRKRLDKEAKYILREVFAFGSVRKGDLARLTGKSDATARKIMNTLIAEGLLIEGEHFKDSVKVSLPTHLAAYYFPGLYPAQIEATLDRKV